MLEPWDVEADEDTDIQAVNRNSIFLHVPNSISHNGTTPDFVQMAPEEL